MTEVECEGDEERLVDCTPEIDTSFYKLGKPKNIDVDFVAQIDVKRHVKLRTRFVELKQSIPECWA